MFLLVLLGKRMASATSPLVKPRLPGKVVKHLLFIVYVLSRVDKPNPGTNMPAGLSRLNRLCRGFVDKTIVTVTEKYTVDSWRLQILW